eukprot:scaffold196_cov371-Prasinococcus_capsulatus_cf.AAC.21
MDNVIFTYTCTASSGVSTFKYVWHLSGTHAFPGTNAPMPLDNQTTQTPKGATRTTSLSNEGSSLTHTRPGLRPVCARPAISAQKSVSTPWTRTPEPPCTAARTHLWVPRVGVCVYVVNVSDMQVVGPSATIGIYQAARICLPHSVDHRRDIKHLVAVILIEGLPLDNARMIAPSTYHGVEVVHEQWNSIVGGTPVLHPDHSNIAGIVRAKSATVWGHHGRKSHKRNSSYTGIQFTFCIMSCHTTMPRVSAW